MSSITLAPDLGKTILRQFDQLKSSGVLFYELTNPEYINDNGFRFQFRTTSIFLSKPILPPTDPTRHKAGGPFSNPEPEFVITPIGPLHLLQLNKFCMFRPSLILHPKEFAPQTTDLDESDVGAAWSVLDTLESGGEGNSEGEGKCEGEGKWMVLYNCGVEAGASQGHKHMQILPRPREDEFRMFPDERKEEFSVGEATCLPHIPFTHWVISIPPNATGSEVLSKYHKALHQTKETLRKHSKSKAYNVIIVREWLILIPRDSKGRNGIGTNSAGMMGMVWLRDENERKGWTELGMSKYLAELGIPNFGGS